MQGKLGGANPSTLVRRGSLSQSDSAQLLPTLPQSSLYLLALRALNTIHEDGKEPAADKSGRLVEG